MTVVARFLVLVLGWSCLVGAGLAVADVDLTSLAGTLVLALVLMPSPFVAAVVAEGGLRRERLALPRRGARSVLVYVLAPGVVVVASLALLVGLVAIGSHLLGPGPPLGAVATSGEQLVASATAALGGAAVEAAGYPPPLPVLLVAAVAGAVVAGWTVNGLVALGEEHGWRGLLWERWRHLGVVRANVLIGVVWGLWHAPVVVQGYNYPGAPALGVLGMVVFCTGASTALTALRELTGSVLPAAAAHGVLNGLAPLLLLLLPGASPVLSGPVGVLSAGAFAAVGAVLWWRVRGRAAGGDPRERSRATPEG